MNILIENAVPLNNGDAALIFSLGEKFEEKGCKVFYSTFHYDEVLEKYPEKNWIISPLSRRFITKIPVIRTMYLKRYLKSKPFYNRVDAVVSAPGGYINSFYGIKKKLILLKLYKYVLKTNVYLYSQSIGELNKKDLQILKANMSIFSLFYVRDNKSLERINDVGKYEQVFLTKDAAFLFEPMKKKESKNSKKKQLAISVRKWTQKLDEIEIYKKNMIRIIRFYQKLDYEITFISTCQGNDKYPDDSMMAKEILNDMKEFGYSVNTIFVDDKAYSLNDFRENISKFDLVIGTRLHMCILSWLAGVPAFNISYEEKGKECYKYLNLEEFSIDYGTYDNELEQKLSNFTDRHTFEPTNQLIGEIHRENLFYFEKLYDNILEGRGNNNESISTISFTI